MRRAVGLRVAVALRKHGEHDSGEARTLPLSPARKVPRAKISEQFTRWHSGEPTAEPTGIGENVPEFVSGHRCHRDVRMLGKSQELREIP